MRRVAGLDFAAVLPPRVGAQCGDILRRVAPERAQHGLGVLRFGDGTTGAVLHAMGRLVRQRVPDLSGAPMGTADHKTVAPGVVRPLQSMLAISLGPTDTFALETPAQRINVSPGSGLDRN